MRVLVCGGRNYRDRDYVFETLDVLHGVAPITFIAEGGAAGPDTFAKEWAIKNGVPGKEYRAKWKQEGRGAGPKRNRRMLRDSKLDMVLAFPGGVGTADMCAAAEWKGILVVRMAGT